MDEMLSTLQEGLQALGISLPPEIRQRLCAFGWGVLRQNEVMNLTAITQPEKVAWLHLLDSLTLLPSLSGKRIIDVGCGAGFPGVPVKIARPELELTLLDSLGKRMNWLAGYLPTIGVDAECVTARAEEEVSHRREQYDMATSRAVARLPILLELTAPYVRVGGIVLAMKGSSAAAELAEAKNAITKLGLSLESVQNYPIDGASHAVITLRKVKNTPPQYPRRYAKIKQSPL